MTRKYPMTEQALLQYKKEGDRALTLKCLRERGIDYSDSFLKEQESKLSNNTSEDSIRTSEYLKAYFYLIVHDNDSYMEIYLKKYCRSMH